MNEWDTPDFVEAIEDADEAKLRWWFRGMGVEEFHALYLGTLAMHRACESHIAIEGLEFLKDE